MISRAARLCDLVVLMLMATNVVLNPPQLRLFSAWLNLPPPFRDDAWSGVVSALGVIIVLLYAWAAAAEDPTTGAGRETLKRTLILAFAALFVVLPTVADMVTRRAVGLQFHGQYVAFPHDGGVLQTEAALDFLRLGRNPYAATYESTAMALSHHSAPALWRSIGLERNPAFTFFPYPPGVLLVSLPFHAVGRWMGGYDQRAVYLAALIALAWIGTRLTREAPLRRLLLAFLLLCPWFIAPFVQGYNDVLCGVFLVAMAVAMRRDRPTGAAVCLALACGAKQFAWLAVPLFVAWSLARPALTPAHRARPLIAFLAVTAAVFGPFLVWNPGALAHGLMAQSSEYPFRAAGLGLSSLLVVLGGVKEPLSRFPAGALQALAATPVLIWGMWRLGRGAGAPLLFGTLGAAILLFVLFSRHFAASYFWLPSMLALIGFVLEDERGRADPRRPLPEGGRDEAA